MKRSFIFAVLLAIAATAWIVSGQFGDSDAQPEAQKPPADLTALDNPPEVRVRLSKAQNHAVVDLLRGRTEANRLVEIKTETSGRVAKLIVENGARVAAGEVIAELDPGDRQARLAEAKALRAQRKIEYEADRKLSQKGFRAETQMAATKASLEAAEAAVKIAEVELSYTVIRAPFDGVVDDHMVEIGDFTDKGDSLARLVELDPMLIVAQVNEREVQRLSVGNPGQARLMTGAVVDGTIRHISSVADPATRTFRVELEVPNPDGAIADGMTAEIALPLEEGEAHLVSPAILTLADTGVIGVKSVDANDTVIFHPIRIVDTNQEGVWIVGPPAETTLITVGQEYVNAGDVVRPIEEQAINARMRELGS